ncbi:hypothetical protein V6N11_061868 [Hibiscus sabdariffa]|uniref:Uncharacterized protein n=1 Tax=Hibiscus sabdariffa TaxID=183260 RepID=A0ABR1ZQZ4_9ROSI
MRRSLSLMVVEASPLPFSSAQHLHLDFMIVPSIFAAKLLFGGFMNDLNVFSICFADLIFGLSLTVDAMLVLVE